MIHGLAPTSLLQCNKDDLLQGWRRLRPRQQFDLLLRYPLEAVPDLATEGPIVVIIDGLDESDIIKEMLDSLFQGFGPQLPFMRLLIFSRPVENILHRSKSNPQFVPALCPDLLWIPVRSSRSMVRRDIKYFISAKFEEIYQDPLTDITFKNACKKRNAVEELASRASGLFIWAATVSKFISEWPL